MSTVTDEMVEAACRTYEPAIRNEFLHNFKGSTMWDAMQAALEAAEAVRVKPPLTMRVDSDPRVSQSAAFVMPAEPMPFVSAFTVAPAIPEGFIPWSGGECPVASGTTVDTVFRGGTSAIDCKAAKLRWDHKFKTISDIIAYRIHRDRDFRLEAGRFYITASGERVGPMKPYRSPFGARFTIEGDARLWMPEGTLDGRFYDILALAADQGENNE